jgi:predicted phosphodiesterase
VVKHSQSNETREQGKWGDAPTYNRVILFGGVYSNYISLEYLLKECQKMDAEAIFCLGDIGGFGPHPNRSYEHLQDTKVTTLAGNYDLSLSQGLDDCGCGYTDPRDNHFAQISYDYTFQNTSQPNKDWLITLPRLIRFRLADLKVLLCHGSPRRTNEFLWDSSSPDHLLHRFLEDSGADVLCFTHTGLKWYRRLTGNRHTVNVGVIGRPENDGTPNVWFTLLEAREQDLKCFFLPLDYNHSRLIDEMKKEHLPSEFIETIQTGWWTTCTEIMPFKERLRGRF